MAHYTNFSDPDTGGGGNLTGNSDAARRARARRLSQLRGGGTSRQSTRAARQASDNLYSSGLTPF